MFTNIEHTATSGSVLQKFSIRFTINLLLIFAVLTAIWLLLTPEVLNYFFDAGLIPEYLDSLRQWLMATSAVVIFYLAFRKERKVLSGLLTEYTESAKTFNFMMDLSEDEFWELDLNSDTIKLNAKSKERFKFDTSRENFTLKELFAKMDDEFADKGKDLFESLKTGRLEEVEFEFRIKENSGEKETWLKCFAKRSGSVNINNGKIAIGYFRDVSEVNSAKQEQQKLIYQREVLLKRLKLQIDKMPIGYMITDKDFQIQFMNPAAEHIFNFSQDELKGKKPYGYIFDRDDEQSFENTRKEIIEHGDTSVIVLENTRKEGARIYCEWFNTPLWSDNGEFNLLSMVVDITSKVEAEMELKAAKEKAEGTSKMKSIFLAQMSHEIRTPVSTIMNYTSMLNEYLHNSSDENFSEIFDSIDNGARRLIRTIDLILNMSQLQTGYYETEKAQVDIVADIIEPLIADMQSAAAVKGIDLIVENSVGNTNFITDSYISGQIISNLVDNAIKYTQKGYVRIGINREGTDKICVEIEDTGIGISKEYQEKIFTPFSQEDMGYTRSFDGNGLGLALVKKYCELIGAEISLDSQKGKGSKFTVVFKETIPEEKAQK
jgi:PAS domain S-box-containing protein